MRITLLDFIENHPNGGTPERVARLAHGRQRNGGGSCPDQVVEADD